MLFRPLAYPMAQCVAEQNSPSVSATKPVAPKAKRQVCWSFADSESLPRPETLSFAQHVSKKIFGTRTGFQGNTFMSFEPSPSTEQFVLLLTQHQEQLFR